MNTKAFYRVAYSREFIVFISLIILGAVLTSFSPQFLSLENISNLLLQISGITIVAVGMTMVIITGGFDVSVGSTLGLVAVIIGKAALAGVHPGFIPVIALASGSCLGAINGNLIAFGRIPPIIATLGTMNILRASIFQMLGGRWISKVPAGIRWFGISRFLGIPVPMWFAIIIALIFAYFLSRRPSGRYVYALGGNPEAANLAGINLRRVQITVYSITGALAGLAALIYVGRTGIVQTNTGVGFELDVIAAVVLGGTSTLGGKGSIVGSVAGALLVGVIKNGLILLNVPALWEGMIIGGLILMAVTVDTVRQRGIAA
ncbi:MAG TPA: ABC transporter permease [Firmicutes bacterium]|nr:ABC transporter permease [Bacillota bacterium]